MHSLHIFILAISAILPSHAAPGCQKVSGKDWGECKNEPPISLRVPLQPVTANTLYTPKRQCHQLNDICVTDNHCCSDLECTGQVVYKGALMKSGTCSYRTLAPVVQIAPPPKATMLPQVAYDPKFRPKFQPPLTVIEPKPQPTPSCNPKNAPCLAHRHCCSKRCFRPFPIFQKYGGCI